MPRSERTGTATEPGREFGYRDLGFFLRFVRPVRSWGAAALLLTFAATAAGTLLPLNGKFLIDFVVLKQQPQIAGWLERLLPGLAPLLRGFVGNLPRLLLAMAFLGAAAGLASLAREYAALRFQQGLTLRLQSALFDHLLRFPHSFFKERHVGYLMSRVSDDVHALEFLFSHSLAQIITRFFSLALGLAILFSLSLRLTLAALLTLPAALAINFLFSARLRRASRSEREATAQVAQDIQEVLAGVEVVKSHAAEEREARRVGDRMRGMYSSRLRTDVLSLSSGTLARGLQFATTVLVLWLGAGEMSRGAMTIGDYVAFTTYLVYLSGAVGFFSSLHLSLQPLLAALERIAEIFAVIPEGAAPGAETPQRPASVRGEIRFEEVGFSYRDTHRPVLQALSFTLPPGATVALVGKSGTGKTTVANLMLKFYLPETGRILLDGRDYRTLDTQWLREHIGVVHQETFLFEDTVGNNIRYGRPDAGSQEVEAAARRALIHEEILHLPSGYETLVGERGARLSVGQKQRISIARAFLKDPPILILDEPTSALDAAAEARLRESMAELIKGRTVLLITHRGTMTGFADRVLELEAGAIRERDGA